MLLYAYYMRTILYTVCLFTALTHQVVGYLDKVYLITQKKGHRVASGQRSLSPPLIHICWLLPAL